MIEQSRTQTGDIAGDVSSAKIIGRLQAQQTMLVLLLRAVLGTIPRKAAEELLEEIWGQKDLADRKSVV